MSNGQRPARTAQDVAQLEADNEYYHTENERLQRELAVVSADRSRLQVENALLDGKSRDAVLKLTRMETIIRVHSAGLVAALTELNQERVTERAVRRQVQENQLAEETGTAPTFLTRGTERTRPHAELNSGSDDTEGSVQSDTILETEVGGQRSQDTPTERLAVRPEARRESDQDREDRLRGAAERLAPAPRPLSRPTPRIDTTLADRDSRMPGGPFTRADAGDLEQLAGVIRSTK